MIMIGGCKNEAVFRLLATTASFRGAYSLPMYNLFSLLACLNTPISCLWLDSLLVRVIRKIVSNDTAQFSFCRVSALMNLFP